ncbi:MAG: hypothetical protein J6Y58_00400 [Clostridiales bacterium]|nr:hypothetical protein [Clostridiales bacterium]
MKRLVCEMCGSVDLVKQEGLFVCQNCQTKYSVEEAKKMMIEGPVQVDNSHLVQNYLEMAERAYKSGNNSETENYCNKIIEVEPKNYRALMLKGKAAGWDSTLKNNRINEAITCFSSAISNAPEEEKEEMIQETKSEVEKLSVALVSLQGERFEKWPDEEEKAGMMRVIVDIINALIQFVTSIGANVINKDELMTPIATKINNSVMDAWNKKIVPEYKNDRDGYPSDSAFRELISRAGHCVDLLEKANTLSDTDDAADVARYNNMIGIHKYVMNSCSYEYRTVEIKGNFFTDYQPSYENRYCKNLTLNESAKAQRNQLIGDYREKIAKIENALKQKEMIERRKEKEEARKRIVAYWEEHADEKAQLEAEERDLTERINAINSDMDSRISKLTDSIRAIPGQSEIARFNAQEKALTSEMANLGLFKGKQKAEMQKQIDNIKAQRNKVQANYNAEKKAIDEQIAMINAEKKKNTKELRDRLSVVKGELYRER